MTDLLLLLDELEDQGPAEGSRWLWELGVSWQGMGPTTTRHATTSADTVDEQDFAFDVGEVGVVHYAGTDPLFVRIDGEAPTTSGETGTYVVLPGTRRVIDRSAIDGPTEVRAISAGIVSYELEVRS